MSSSITRRLECLMAAAAADSSIAKDDPVMVEFTIAVPSEAYFWRNLDAASNIPPEVLEVYQTTCTTSISSPSPSFLSSSSSVGGQGRSALSMIPAVLQLIGREMADVNLVAVASASGTTDNATRLHHHQHPHPHAPAASPRPSKCWNQQWRRRFVVKGCGFAVSLNPKLETSPAVNLSFQTKTSNLSPMQHSSASTSMSDNHSRTGTMSPTSHELIADGDSGTNVMLSVPSSPQTLIPINHKAASIKPFSTSIWPRRDMDAISVLESCQGESEAPAQEKEYTEDDVGSTTTDDIVRMEESSPPFSPTHDSLSPHHWQGRRSQNVSPSESRQEDTIIMNNSNNDNNRDREATPTMLLSEADDTNSKTTSSPATPAVTRRDKNDADYADLASANKFLYDALERAKTSRDVLLNRTREQSTGLREKNAAIQALRETQDRDARQLNRKGEELSRLRARARAAEARLAELESEQSRQNDVVADLERSTKTLRLREEGYRRELEEKTTEIEVLKGETADLLASLREMREGMRARLVVEWDRVSELWGQTNEDLRKEIVQRGLGCPGEHAKALKRDLVHCLLQADN